MGEGLPRTHTEAQLIGMKRTVGCLALLLATLGGVFACDDASPPGAGNGGGDAGGGDQDATTTGNDGGVRVDGGGSLVCPSTSPLERVAAGTLTTPLGSGPALIRSAVVSGNDVYYSFTDRIHKVSTTGQGDAVFFTSSAGGPLDHLAADSSFLYFSDQGTLGIESVPLAGAASSTPRFSGIKAFGAEVEQYFHDGSHFILADRDGANDTKVRQLLRRSNGGAVETLFARTTTFGLSAAYALVGDTFFVADRATEGAAEKSIIAVPANSAPLAPGALPASEVHYNASCDVLLGFGPGHLWCISSFPGVGDQTRTVQHFDPQTRDAGQVLFDPHRHSVSKEEEVITAAATDGATLYFATKGANDGHAVYRVTAAGVVTVLACDLGRVEDMTTGGTYLYVSVDDPNDATKHGLFRLAR